MLNANEVVHAAEERLQETIAANRLRFAPGPEVSLLIDAVVHSLVEGINRVLAAQQVPTFDPKDVALEFMKLLVSKQEQKE